MVQYSPLDPQKSEIRLVTLLPGKSRDAIRCILSTASLDSPPEFTALSYVWGDASKTNPITINNEPFDVTVNLEAALRAIRKRWRRRVLWIDAICINQDDVQEKNVQVPQMGRLYSTAPAVLVWLGPSTPYIKTFVWWMRAHTARSYNATSVDKLTLDTWATLSESGQRNRDSALMQAWEGLNDFQALPYWGRLWTFQEFLLPRIAPLCLCGDIQPFQLTTVLAERTRKSLEQLDGQALKRLGAEYKSGRMNGETMAMYKAVLHRRAARATSPPPVEVFHLPRLRDSPKGRLVELLYHTAGRYCIDERDKVFGLYGMMPAAQRITRSRPPT